MVAVEFDIEPLDYRGHAPPRPVIRSPMTSFFCQKREQSPMAKVELIEYEYRSPRRRSKLYYSTLLRIREVGWRPTKETEMVYPKGKPRLDMFVAESKTTSGAMIRQARLNKHWTQNQVADATGFSQGGIARHERGDSVMLDKRVPVIAEVLDLDADKLMKAVLDDRNKFHKFPGPKPGNARGRPPKRGRKGEPGEMNRRWVIDYLVDDMDFDEDTVIALVTEEKTYTMDDIHVFIDQLMS